MALTARRSDLRRAVSHLPATVWRQLEHLKNGNPSRFPPAVQFWSAPSRRLARRTSAPFGRNSICRQRLRILRQSETSKPADNSKCVSAPNVRRNDRFDAVRSDVSTVSAISLCLSEGRSGKMYANPCPLSAGVIDSMKREASMFWIRLMLLGLVCVAAGCCSTSGSCYEPNCIAAHPPAVSGHPVCACDM